MVDKASRRIICTGVCNGRKHDFRHFKESGFRIHPNISCVTDTGYIGIKKFHANSIIPKKNNKKKPLAKEDKAFNHLVSSVRALNENVIGSIKRFKIVADKYRNIRKRFGLRFNLIAGIYKFEMNN